MVKEEEEEEEAGGDPPLILGSGTRTGNTFVTKLLIIDFYFDCYNKLNDPIIGSLVRDGSRICNEIHSRGQFL